MDKVTSLVAQARLPVLMLANTATRDFELLPALTPISPLVDAALDGRGLCFVGACGIVDGIPRSAFECVLDDGAVTAFAERYLAYVLAELSRPAPTEPKVNDGASWLESLYRLEDPRPES
jgi:hypothetical protein